VIWGRAYLALVDQSGKAFGKCENTGAMILRDGSLTAYDAAWAAKPEPCSQWIIDEGHMKYAWALAEGFAKAAMIDAVRVDVFLWPGHPERAAINECSLSSGAMYKWHFHLMAQLWAEGHKRQEYVLPACVSNKRELLWVSTSSTTLIAWYLQPLRLNCLPLLCATFCLMSVGHSRLHCDAHVCLHCDAHTNAHGTDTPANHQVQGCRPTLAFSL
jgi:hypothetical protein